MSLYKRLGCHHCGTRRGRPIGDHMPPNKSAHGGTDGTYGPVNWQEPEEVLNRLLRQLPGGATRFPPPRCFSCGASLVLFGRNLVLYVQPRPCA